MYGTLAGALAGRKVAFDRSRYTATVDGRIAGVGKTIRIVSITMHYDLTVPADRFALAPGKPTTIAVKVNRARLRWVRLRGWPTISRTGCS